MTGQVKLNGIGLCKCLRGQISLRDCFCTSLFNVSTLIYLQQFLF
jgi:hypothetical protein